MSLFIGDLSLTSNMSRSVCQFSSWYQPLYIHREWNLPQWQELCNSVQDWSVMLSLIGTCPSSVKSSGHMNSSSTGQDSPNGCGQPIWYAVSDGLQPETGMQAQSAYPSSLRMCCHTSKLECGMGFPAAQTVEQQLRCWHHPQANGQTRDLAPLQRY